MLDPEAVAQRYIAAESVVLSCARSVYKDSLDKKDHEDLLIELEILKHDISKASLLFNARARESEAHAKETRALESEANVITDSIASLELELEEAISSRKNREEYNRLVKVVNEEPSRHQSSTSISTLNEEIESITSRKEDLLQLKQLRSEQFALFFKALDQVKHDLSPVNSVSDAAMDVDD